MYTEATTKDGNLGIIVVTDSIKQTLSELLDWIKQNGIKGKELNPIRILNVAAGEKKDRRFATPYRIVGHVNYDGDQLVFTPGDWW